MSGFEELNSARADQGCLTGGLRVNPRAQRLRGPSGVFEQFEPPTSRAFKGLLWIRRQADRQGLARTCAPGSFKGRYPGCAVPLDALTAGEVALGQVIRYPGTCRGPAGQFSGRRPEAHAGR